MNAIDLNADRPAPRAVAAVHPTHTFRLLLRREFWEHRGGFLWAPMVAGAIFLLLSIMGIGVGELAARRVMDSNSHAMISTDDGNFRLNGLDLSKLTEKLNSEDVRELGGAVDGLLFMAGSWPLMVLAFVVFFYCLGSLYDERKDRSVLFWKSLPVSDGQTVLSKVASATLTAPALAVAASLLTMIGFLLILSVVVMFHGGNPITLLWGPGSPFTVALNLLAGIPIYALWALPTVGWLMLCSSWARSKPFLWAIMIPLFAGIFVSWFDLMQLFNLESGWFWKNIVARSLVSVFPGGWIDAANIGEINGEGPSVIHEVINLRTMYSVLGSLQLWIGAAAGAAMIFAAVRLRRWRDEG
ncbi:hypothetical protein V1318_01070 [Lysobacter sp. CCNWLW3]|uniref:hypothetical protein n=1 Tax=unclassified Lysobacter TaxID=2635362 RepID=UPI002FD5E0CD